MATVTDSSRQYEDELRIQLNYLKPTRLSETSTVKMLNLLKGLANLHILLGTIMIVLSSMADYVSNRINTIRLNGLEEICAFYFVFTGLMGLCGSASYRRGLVITYLVMCIHAVFIIAPAIIIVSSFDIHFYQHECWGECDWHLLSTSFPDNSRCQILCGSQVNDPKRRTMTRLGTDIRLDVGIIVAAICEIFLALITIVVAIRTLFGPEKGQPLELEPLNNESHSDNK